MSSGKLFQLVASYPGKETPWNYVVDVDGGM